MEIVDQDGCLVTCAEHQVSFEVSGAGELIAIGTANPLSEEAYVAQQRQAWHGRLLAVIRSSGQPGEIVLNAQAEGLSASELRLDAKEMRKA